MRQGDRVREAAGGVLGRRLPGGGGRPSGAGEERDRFNYRRLPALSLMKQMVDSGRIGKVRLWRGSWLSDEFVDPEIPFDWRFERSVGASTIADLGAHLLDLAGWLVGEIDAVSAQSQTFTLAEVGPGGESERSTSTTPPRHCSGSGRARSACSRWRRRACGGRATSRSRSTESAGRCGSTMPD